MRTVRETIAWFKARNPTMPGATAMYQAAIHYMQQYVKLSGDYLCQTCRHNKGCFGSDHGEDIDCKTCKKEGCPCKDCTCESEHWEMDDVG